MKIFSVVRFNKKKKWTDDDFTAWFNWLRSEGEIDRLKVYLVLFDDRTPSYMQCLLWNWLYEDPYDRWKVYFPSRLILLQWIKIERELDYRFISQKTHKM